jgi:hypothetical protein
VRRILGARRFAISFLFFMFFFPAIEFLFRVNIETAERSKALGSSGFSQRGA